MGFIFTVTAFVLGYSALLYAHDDIPFPPLVHYEVPPTCPKNEMYRLCLTNCSKCEDRGRRCVPTCLEHGCDCLPHFVRLNGPESPCEPVSFCPKQECGENEEFRACGPMCEMCAEVQCRVIHCEYRCYCRQGYMRDANRTCIPKANCPRKTKCSSSEERTTSGPEDDFCTFGDLQVASNATSDREMCYCKPGFKRNFMGHCTHDKFCEYLNCRESEIYDPCPRQCNNTCRNYEDKTCVENGDCFPGCVCSEGLLKNDYGKCVPLEECPPNSNPFAPTALPSEEPQSSTGSYDTLSSILITSENTPLTTVTPQLEPQVVSTVSPKVTATEATTEQVIEIDSMDENVPRPDALENRSSDEPIDVPNVESITSPAPTLKIPKQRRNKTAERRSPIRSRDFKLKKDKSIQPEEENL